MSKFGAAEAEVRDLAVGRRDDAVDAARLVADLDAHARRDVEPAVAVDPHAVGAGVVGGVGHVQMVVTAACRPASRRAGPGSCRPSASGCRRHRAATGRARA